MAEKYKQLVADFPRLLRHDPEDPDPFAVWGFQCGDGWFALIYKLCADIEQAAREAGLDPDSADWPRVMQVKEKFGTLRFYIRTPSASDDATGLSRDASPAPEDFTAFRPIAGIEKIRELVAAAEQASATICEECGHPGELLTAGGYWRTRCLACAGGE